MMFHCLIVQLLQDLDLQIVLQLELYQYCLGRLIYSGKQGIYTDIIVSDLGAWNSRNLDWRDIERNTKNFIEFIVECGFD